MYDIGVIHGRFQVPHNDHLRYLLAGKALCRHLVVGLTNPDPSLPTERGQVPGTGSLVALLSTASGVEPEFVGKPYPGMYQQAMQHLGTAPAATLMVGDRYETDIIGALDLGMPTVGVTTGVTTAVEFAAMERPPQLVLSGLPELLETLRAADAG